MGSRHPRGLTRVHKSNFHIKQNATISRKLHPRDGPCAPPSIRGGDAVLSSVELLRPARPKPWTSPSSSTCSSSSRGTPKVGRTPPSETDPQPLPSRFQADRRGQPGHQAAVRRPPQQLQQADPAGGEPHGNPDRVAGAEAFAADRDEPEEPGDDDEPLGGAGGWVRGAGRRFQRGRCCRGGTITSWRGGRRSTGESRCFMCPRSTFGCRTSCFSTSGLPLVASSLKISIVKLCGGNLNLPGNVM